MEPRSDERQEGSGGRRPKRRGFVSMTKMDREPPHDLPKVLGHKLACGPPQLGHTEVGTQTGLPPPTSPPAFQGPPS
jgi:hypothetical protein